MLDKAERQVLDETARQLRADDPHLAQKLRRRPVRNRLFHAGVAGLAVLTAALLVLGQLGQASVLAIVTAGWWAYRRYQDGRALPGADTWRDRGR